MIHGGSTGGTMSANLSPVDVRLFDLVIFGHTIAKLNIRFNGMTRQETISICYDEQCWLISITR